MQAGMRGMGLGIAPHRNIYSSRRIPMQARRAERLSNSGRPSARHDLLGKQRAGRLKSATANAWVLATNLYFSSVMADPRGRVALTWPSATDDGRKPPACSALVPSARSRLASRQSQGSEQQRCSLSPRRYELQTWYFLGTEGQYKHSGRKERTDVVGRGEDAPSASGSTSARLLTDQATGATPRRRRSQIGSWHHSSGPDRPTLPVEFDSILATDHSNLTALRRAVARPQNLGQVTNQP